MGRLKRTFSFNILINLAHQVYLFNSSEDRFFSWMMATLYQWLLLLRLIFQKQL